MSMKFDREKTIGFARGFNRGMLRMSLVSVFWAVISEKKRTSGFTLKELADRLGIGKSNVSRWFSGEPNWSINTIADISDALDVDLKVLAVDRKTGRIYGPSGQMPTVVRTFSSHSLTVAGRSPEAWPKTDSSSGSTVIAA